MNGSTRENCASNIAHADDEKSEAFLRCWPRQGETVFDSNTLTELDAANVQAAPSRTTRVLASLNHRLQGYFPALGAFLLAMALHTLASLLFTPHVVGTLAFFLYLLAFLTAAWCGYGPGLLVTILITCAHAVPVQAGLLDSNG